VATEPEQHRRSYEGRLLKPSLPEYPGWPSLKNVNEWRRRTIESEQEGIALLFKHYDLGNSELQAERDKYLELILVLARHHVPFFRTRKTKRPVWDSFVLAQLLQNYQDNVKKSYLPRAARSAAKQKLPPKLAIDITDKTIENRVAHALVRFKYLVKTTRDGSVTPMGDFEARIWQFLLDGLDVGGRVGPVPNDPDAVMVSGLPEIPE
jgi:hypothetical protein